MAHLHQELHKWIRPIPWSIPWVRRVIKNAINDMFSMLCYLKMSHVCVSNSFCSVKYYEYILQPIGLWPAELRNTIRKWIYTQPKFFVLCFKYYRVLPNFFQTLALELRWLWEYLRPWCLCYGWYIYAERRVPLDGREREPFLKSPKSLFFLAIWRERRDRQKQGDPTSGPAMTR